MPEKKQGLTKSWLCPFRQSNRRPAYYESESELLQANLVGPSVKTLAFSNDLLTVLNRALHSNCIPTAPAAQKKKKVWRLINGDSKTLLPFERTKPFPRQFPCQQRRLTHEQFSLLFSISNKSVAALQ
jgi:hypothetical protein